MKSSKTRIKQGLFIFFGIILIILAFSGLFSWFSGWYPQNRFYGNDWPIEMDLAFLITMIIISIGIIVIVFSHELSHFSFKLT